ncbi:MAG: type II toxin-antitoxin system RelE/ParE family toxin [Bacteroidetes bacterium]|nr:MAG: type II toxin-antitoxin system RelE/ParE family toxin [Bacteroidota bacterium]
MERGAQTDQIQEEVNFEVIITPIALGDVQDAVDYYDEQSVGLGEKFEAELNEFLIALEHNPFFQNRYETVRCLPLKKFPFMVHFSILEEKQLVVVHAVFHTSLNPESWKGREK